MNSKTLAIFVVAIVAVAAIVGVGVYWFTQPPPPPEPEKVVVIAMSAAPPTLDAPGWTGMELQTVAWALYDRLVDIDVNSHIVPGLAESWTVSDDGLTWTFYLRSGVKFHDGTDFNADAVKYNIDRILREKIPSSYRLFSAINKTIVVNATTIQFVTNTPYPPLLTHLAYVVGGISSPTALAAHAANYSYYVSTTGPYKLASYIPGSKIELVANKDYWGPKPQLDRIIYLIVTDPSTRVIALQRGDVQVVETVPLTQLDSLRRENITIFVENERMIYYALNNTLLPKKVRLAINYAIDKNAIINDLLKGTATISRCPIPPLTLYAINSCTPFPYNPTYARQLLAEAGYPNGLNITIETLSGRYVYDKEVTQIIQSQLAAVGINAKIVVNEYGTHFTRLRTARPVPRVEMAQIGWGTSTCDPDYFITSMYYGKLMPPLSYNQGYRNATVDALIEQGARETDPTRRAAIYAQIQQLIWDDVPALWLYTQPTIYAWKSNIHGIEIMPTGAVNMRNAYIG